MTIDATELHRRLRALDVHLAESTDLFDHFWPLELGPPTGEAALAEAEQACGIPAPEPLRSFLLQHAASGRFGYSLKEEHLEALDAEYTGAQGGFMLLSPVEMVEARARIAAYMDEGFDLGAMLPFVKDHSAATWLCVTTGRHGVVVAHVHHDADDGEFERWDADGFFDGWSASGFSVDFRWEDQPEQVVARFREAFGLEPE
ncbi:MAG: hypothetical protein IPL19_11130 [Sandaracinaceae bacterium]|nr:hypothetical protein [Sandaracinaceae bacterium]MBK7154004.1 hypothetical protein [Sandaracinaceae bacterium]MBK8408520.1 hypothetical protein [Sandaracinaceae bacterium]